MLHTQTSQLALNLDIYILLHFYILYLYTFNLANTMLSQMLAS